MKLKYYLRGMGIGVILTAIIMGFALGGRNKPVSDAEIIERAKNLGMVEGGVLTDYSVESVSIGEKHDGVASASGASEEVVKDLASADVSFTEMAKENTKLETKELTDKKEDKSSESTSSAASAASSKVVKATAQKDSSEANKDTKKEEAKKAETPKEEPKKEEPKKEESKKEEVKKEEPKEEVKEETAAAANSVEVPAEVPPENATSVTVKIPGGMSSDSVAELLYKEGLVDNAVSFNKYLIQKGVDRRIRSGSKTFTTGSTYEQIADVIVK